MSRKINNRVLLIVFLALAAIFVITRFTSAGRTERNLRTDLGDIDTARVTAMLLFPQAEQGGEIRFERRGDGWTVTHEGITADADARNVRSTLAELRALEAQQLVARSPERWSDYLVEDSLATRVVVKEDNKTTMDLVVGRFQYQPPPQNSYNPYGQSRVSGKTYVRLHGEEEVYSVEGFLAMSLNQNFERWRDQSVTRLNRSQVTRIVYDYPADSGFIAEKSNGSWMVAGLMADSASMATCLGRVSHKSHSRFMDDFQPPAEPDFRVSFEGDNMQPQQVRAYLQPDSMVVLNSSINPGSWFSAEMGSLFNDLFPPADELIGRKE